MVENVCIRDGCLNVRLCVILLSSVATVNPSKVTARAINFKCGGMVIWGVVCGIVFIEMKKPIKMLPRINRLIGLTRCGLFSLIRVSVGYRGCPRRAKKMIRVL